MSHDPAPVPLADDRAAERRRLDEQYVLGTLSQAEYEQARERLADPPPAAPVALPPLPDRPPPESSPRGRILRAVAVLAALLACWSAIPMVFDRLASWQIESPDKAIAITNVGLALRPGARLYIHRAEAYYRQGEFEKAIRDAGESIRLDPKQWVHWIVRGKSYLALGRYSEAQADFDEVIRLEPDLIYGYRWRADAYQGQGQADLALRDATRAIELSPASAGNYYVRATIYMDQKRYADAGTDLDSALKLDDGELTVGILLLRSVCYTRLGNYAEVIATTERVMAIDPEHPVAYNNRGKAYALQGQYDRALQDYDRAFELGIEGARPFCNRGVAHRELGFIEEAVADFQACLASQPDDEDRTVAESALRELGVQP